MFPRRASVGMGGLKSQSIAMRHTAQSLKPLILVTVTGPTFSSSTTYGSSGCRSAVPLAACVAQAWLLAGGCTSTRLASSSFGDRSALLAAQRSASVAKGLHPEAPPRVLGQSVWRPASSNQVRRLRDSSFQSAPLHNEVILRHPDLREASRRHRESERLANYRAVSEHDQNTD